MVETECSHHVWHVPNFDHFLKNSSVGTSLLGPRFFTRQRYGLRLLLHRYSDCLGVFTRLVSTDHDGELQSLCVWRQVTVSLLDQSHHVQQRMSKQTGIATDSERTFTGGDWAALISDIMYKTLSSMSWEMFCVCSYVESVSYVFHSRKWRDISLLG